MILRRTPVSGTSLTAWTLRAGGRFSVWMMDSTDLSSDLLVQIDDLLMRPRPLDARAWAIAPPEVRALSWAIGDMLYSPHHGRHSPPT